MNNKTAVLCTLCLTSFLVPYMGSSLNLALPQIAEALSLDAKKLGWVNSSFLIATAVFQVPFAKIGDLLGRKKVFLLGVALFGAASVACAFAWNFASLVVFRVFAGLGGAMVFGSNMAILASVFDKHERGKAMGTVTSVVYMALAVGPFCGGMLTHYFGWQSVFYIPGAILVLQAFGTAFLIRDEWREDSSKKFDASGALIFGVAVFCLIFGFSELPMIPAFVLVVAGIFLFAFFYRFERKKDEPVFQVHLFKNKVFTLSSLAAFFNYAATMAIFFMLSLYLQYIRGFDARTAGLVMLSSALVQSAASFNAGRLSDKFEASKIAMLGMGISAICLILFIFIEVDTSMFAVCAVLLFLGLGLGIFSSPNTKVIMNSVEHKYISQASAAIGTMRLAGQAFSMGIAMMSISLFVGDSQITAENSNFMEGLKFTFAICALMCIAGTFASSVNAKANVNSLNLPKHS